MTANPVRTTKHQLDAKRLDRLFDHFVRYVDDGRLPGFEIVVGHGGQRVFHKTYGQRDLEAKLAWEPGNIFRLYSNTKIVTAVAALMLWERGAFELLTPVKDFIPSIGNSVVYRAGSATSPVTEPQLDPMRIWQLFAHTAGFTYGFMHAHPVDAIYRNNGFEWGTPAGMDLEQICDKFASFPLVFQPGTEWNYSVSIDVLGRITEIASGKKLDEFFHSEIFEPLGMTDTGFHCPEDKQDRLAALYLPLGPNKTAVRVDQMGNAAKHKPTFLSGGGGLVGTAEDYFRFLEMLQNGGAANGHRFLSPTTIEMMASNHLPNNADLEKFGRPLFAETPMAGVGFGLGVSVTLDPRKAKSAGSVGDWGWGGAASTSALLDPVEDLVAFFATQLLPSSTWPIRSEMRQLIHQALV